MEESDEFEDSSKSAPAHSVSSSSSKSSNSDDSQSVLSNSLSDNGNSPSAESKSIDALFIEPSSQDSRKQFKKAFDQVVLHHSPINSLKKDDLLYHPQSKITFKVLQPNQAQINPSISIQSKAEASSSPITVTLDSFNDYTEHRDVRIVYVNDHNKTRELTYPVDINRSFEEFFKSFASTYKFPIDSMTIIYKEAKVTQLSATKFSSFDFDTEYILVLETISFKTRTHKNSIPVTVSSPLISSYVAFPKKNIEIKTIQPVEITSPSSSYIEIYQLTLCFDKDFMDKSTSKTGRVLCSRLLQSNWIDKASLAYTLPLQTNRPFDDQEGDQYIPSGSVTLKEGTVYVFRMHLYFNEAKSLKRAENYIINHEEIEVIGEKKQFFIGTITLAEVSDLFLN